MNADPRYPVGKFAPPAARDAARITAGIATLTALPAKLRSAVEELDEASLETPCRSGGWTIRQVVHHLADSHVNAYCRMRLALTEDQPTIRTYQEQLWAELVDSRTLPLGTFIADSRRDPIAGHFLAGGYRHAWDRQIIGTFSG